MLNRIAALVWGLTGAPVYRRLFGAPLTASINRLNSVLGQLSEIRLELTAIRAELAETRVREQQLDGRIRDVVASNWDTTALTRRLASIEERLANATEQDGADPRLEASRTGR